MMGLLKYIQLGGLFDYCVVKIKKVIILIYLIFCNTKNKSVYFSSKCKTVKVLIFVGIIKNFCASRKFVY